VNDSTLRLVIVLALAGPTAALPATAQTRAGLQSPEYFGPAASYRVLHASSWTSQDGTPNPRYHWSTPGYVGPDSTGAARYWVQLDLPIGAVVDSVTVPVYDNDNGGAWLLDVIGLEAARPNADPAETSITSVTSGWSLQPGLVDLTLYPHVTIRAWADINGDGYPTWVSYILSLYGFQSSADTLMYWGAILYFRRTVAPAPASATFADVPTGHWAFQFVESLATSTITAGCGGGNYCPDDPVTRAQMAVYLSSALGLYWNY